MKNEFNSNSIHLPVVLDSPNNVELDDEKRKELFDYLFSNADSSTQMIISTLGFTKSDYPDNKIDNIVTLENPKYSLLSSEEYITYLDILTRCDNEG